MSPTLRCSRCGEVIGVYEPLVALVEGGAHETSRANEPHVAEGERDRYHRACYEQLPGAASIPT